MAPGGDDGGHNAGGTVVVKVVMEVCDCDNGVMLKMAAMMGLIAEGEVMSVVVMVVMVVMMIIVRMMEAKLVIRVVIMDMSVVLVWWLQQW